MAETAPTYRCPECSYCSDHGLKHETTCSQWTLATSAIYSFIPALGTIINGPASTQPYVAFQNLFSSRLSKEGTHVPIIAIPLALLTPVSKTLERAVEQGHENSHAAILDLKTVPRDVFEEFVLWVVNPPPPRVTRAHAQARKLVRGEQFLELYMLGQKLEIPKLQNWALDEYYTLLEGGCNPGATSIINDLPKYWPRLPSNSPLREWMYQLLGSEYESCLSVGVKWPGEDRVKQYEGLWLGIQNAVKDYRSSNAHKSMRDLIRARDWNEYYIKEDSPSNDDTSTVDAGHKVAPAFDALVSTSRPSVVPTRRSSLPAISTGNTEPRDESLEATMQHQTSDITAKLSSTPGTPAGHALGGWQHLKVPRPIAANAMAAHAGNDNVQALSAALRLGADLPSPVTLTPEEIVIDGDRLVGNWKDLANANRVVRSSHSTYGFMVQDRSGIWRPVIRVRSRQAASRLAQRPVLSRSPSLAAPSPANEVETGGRVPSTDSVRSHGLPAAPRNSHSLSKEPEQTPAEASAVTESAKAAAQPRATTDLDREISLKQAMPGTTRAIPGKLRASIVSPNQSAKDRSGEKATGDNIDGPDTPESEYDHYMHGSTPAVTPSRVAAESDFLHNTDIASYADLQRGALRHQQKTLPSMEFVLTESTTTGAAAQHGPRVRNTHQGHSDIRDLDNGRTAVMVTDLPLPDLSHTILSQSKFSSGHDGHAEPAKLPHDGRTSPTTGMEMAVHENRLNTLADMAIANSSSRPSSSMSQPVSIRGGVNLMLQSDSRGPSFSPLSASPPTNETQPEHNKEQNASNAQTDDHQAEPPDVEMLSDSFNSGSEKDPSDDEDFQPPGNESPPAQINNSPSSPLAPAAGPNTPSARVSSGELRTPTLKRELEFDGDDNETSSPRRSKPSRTRSAPKPPARFEGSGMVVDHSPDAFPKREMHTMVFTMKEGRKVVEWTLK